MRWLFRHLSVLALVVFFTTSAQAAEVPELRGRVNDYANVLTQEQETELETALERIETYEGRPQVVILTMSDIGGEEIEEYSLRVARTWGIGQRDTDNGLLILVLTDAEDFGVRIEVGYGLEGAIPDATARAVYERTMRPHFRDAGHENYAAGLMGGIRAFDTIIRGESTGDIQIDNAVEIQRRSNSVMLIIGFGGILAGFIGFLHWSLSGVVGSATGILLGMFLGYGWLLIALFVVVGFVGGLIAHGIALAKASGGGGSYIGSGGSFSGGFSGGGGGGFGGGGFSGGR